MRLEYLGQADIVAGTVELENSAASTPVITVPAGRTWKGWIALSIVDTGTAAATFSDIQALTAGTDVDPVVGSILLQVNTHPGGTAAIEAHNAIEGIIRAPSGNSVTVNAILSSAAATLRGSCSCSGYLVA